MPFVPRFGRLFLPDPRDALYPMRQFLPPRPPWTGKRWIGYSASTAKRAQRSRSDR